MNVKSCMLVQFTPEKNIFTAKNIKKKTPVLTKDKYIELSKISPPYN